MARKAEMIEGTVEELSGDPVAGEPVITAVFIPEPLAPQAVWAEMEKIGFYGDKLRERIANSGNLWDDLVGIVSSIHAHNATMASVLASVPPNASQLTAVQLAAYMGALNYSPVAIDTAARSTPNPWLTLFAIATDQQQYNMVLRSQALAEASN